MNSLQIATLAEWGPPPKRVAVVDGLVARGEIMLLTGDPGSGKTAVAARLAAAVSHGAAFLGRATDAGQVVFLSGERPNSAQRRLYAAGAAEDVLQVKGDASLLEDADAIIEIIASRAPLARMIVIDTFGAYTKGMNENGSEMSAAAGLLRRISDNFPEAALVVVHHLNKGSDGAAKTPRGHSSFLATVDIELRSEAAKGKRRLRVANANHVEENQKLPFSLRPVDVDGEEEVAAVDEGGVTAEMVHRSQINKAKAQENIARLDRALPMAEPTVDDVLSAMAADGMLANVAAQNHRRSASRAREKLREFRSGTSDLGEVQNAG